MKDIIIDTKRQKKELWWLAGAFVLANIFNIRAIYRYDAPVKEIYTSFFYVLIFTLFLYAVSVVIRLIVYGLRQLMSRKKSIETN